MIERILTVGGFTLLSRVSGFIRDIILAAVLGAGPVADAFFVALRLPNHFRAIFAEGAFNAAFVPAYASIREQGGAVRAGQFADRIFTLLLASQIVLLAVALVFTPAVIDVLAPGFARDPGRFALAVELTRITFPYLLLITLVTLYGGILNALQRFAVAAAGGFEGTLEVRALGAEGLAELRRLGRPAKGTRALRLVPSFWRESALLAVPPIDFWVAADLERLLSADFVGLRYNSGVPGSVQSAEFGGFW